MSDKNELLIPLHMYKSVNGAFYVFNSRLNPSDSLLLSNLDIVGNEYVKKNTFLYFIYDEKTGKIISKVYTSLDQIKKFWKQKLKKEDPKKLVKPLNVGRYHITKVNNPIPMII